MSELLQGRPPADPWREARAAEWMGEGMTPAEWAARNSHKLAMSSLFDLQYREPALDAWIHELRQILMAPGAVEAARRRYLTPKELKWVEKQLREPF
jgi:hypothetical protein